jgi:putative salt-induced outer membrane protein
MLMKSLTMFALALALAHGAASASPPVPETTWLRGSVPTGPLKPLAPGSWSTAAELGAITTSGNTVGTSVTGRIDARQELSNWSNQYTFSGFFKEDEAVGADGKRVRQRSAERFSLSARAAFKLLKEGERLFVFGSHVNDKFGAFTRFSTLAVGHSSQWYKSDNKAIDVEVGPGYFSGQRATGVGESGFTVHGAALIRWQVSPSAQFSQTVSVERGTSNVHSMAESALSTRIYDTMQMKAAFSVRSDSNVPSDKKKTDTQTSLTLVYSF